MAAFDKVNKQWEDVNKQIETLMTEARSADRSDAAAMNALREKFIGLQKQGKDLLPQLRSTGMPLIKKSQTQRRRYRPRLLASLPAKQ